MNLLLLASCLGAAAASNFPPKTFSEVCPAIDFQNDWDEYNGNYAISFRPPLHLHFDFVDLHVALETPGGQLIGKVRNYKMSPGPDGVWEAPLTDQEHLTALNQRRTDAVVRYSFTYCVGMGEPMKPVDCDTEVFDINPVTFYFREALMECPTDCGLQESMMPAIGSCIGSDGQEYPASYCSNLQKPTPIWCAATAPCVTFGWRPLPVVCPTDCGLGASEVLPDVECVGSDGQLYPDANCATIPRPSTKFCPATEPCVSFGWRPLPVVCPTDCGLGASEVLPDVECVGSDGQMYPDAHCATIPRPSTKFCPATAPCVKFNWRPLPIVCPTRCGLGASEVLPDVECWGSDGQLYPDAHCANIPRPGPKFCPATEPCVSFGWRPLPIVCPTDCGLGSSEVLPDVECVGSDGQLYPDAHCATIPRPAAKFCPATEPCVTFDWRGGLVECPTECGLPATTIMPPTKCFGSDGQEYPASYCANLPTPEPVYCDATAPCVHYTWREGLVECPTECGLPSSVITPPTQCVGSDGSFVEHEREALAVCGPPPKPVNCPATAKCPKVPKQCPALSFVQRVEKVSGTHVVVFTPVSTRLGDDAQKHAIEWIDVHVSVVDQSGVTVENLKNYRMDKPERHGEHFDFTHKIDSPSVRFSLQNPQYKLAYFFTYCIDMVDCDTDTFYYTPSAPMIQTPYLPERRY